MLNVGEIALQAIGLGFPIWLIPHIIIVEHSLHVDLV